MSYVGLRIFSCKLNIYHKFLGKLDNTQYEGNTIKNFNDPISDIIKSKYALGYLLILLLLLF